MNIVLNLISNSGASILLLAALTAISGPLDNLSNTQSAEQTSFGMENTFDHAVALNEGAKKALAADQGIADVLRDDKLLIENVAQKWFTASEIHLGKPNETDLVVMSSGIELGANTTIFRILRQTPTGYAIVLHTQALGLDVLNTSTNGLRDIEASAMVGGYLFSNEFLFDGDTYRLVKRSSQLAGVELPHDLAGFETHKPFVQSRGQDEEPILAGARTWIWQRWQACKRSYVEVSTEDEDGEKEAGTISLTNPEMESAT